LTDGSHRVLVASGSSGRHRLRSDSGSQHSSTFEKGIDMARTDNDTWDLSTSVGATATGVAASRALASRGPDPLINDPFAEPLVRAVGIELFSRLASGEFVADADDEDPVFNVRLMAEHITVRTRFFDNFFLDAGRAGFRQAVILASGLDTRAYRLAWPAGTVVYEVDQPQVIQFKTDTLAGLGATPAAERRAIGIDLRDDWPTALRQHGFDATQPTAWIAEGLLIYLPPEAQDRLFDHIAGLSAPGSRVACEQIPDIEMFDNDRAQALVERARKYGFDVDMAELFYPGERRRVTEYLSEHGWRPTTSTSAELYAANGFTAPDPGATAQFGELSYVSAVLAD
jgi:methyltransferase (TIGR00027 family)